MMELIVTFSVSLGLTILLEGALAWCLGMRRRDQLKIVLLVNLLTNPLAVWLHVIGNVSQIPIEIGVVIIECYVYHWFRREQEIPHPLTLSLVTNSASWAMGLVLSTIF